MIVADPATCSGCSRCEVNCSFFHSGKVGRSGARIKVVKIEGIGVDFPVICQQCRERYCARCPESAIEIGPLGQVIVSATLCNACGACEKRCPVGAIELFEEIPYVCDLCGGEPRCVGECPMGAIRFDRDATGGVSLASFKEDARGRSPEEKRLRFAMASSWPLRDRWLSERRG